MILILFYSSNFFEFFKITRFPLLSLIYAILSPLSTPSFCLTDSIMVILPVLDRLVDPMRRAFSRFSSPYERKMFLAILSSKKPIALPSSKFKCFFTAEGNRVAYWWEIVEVSINSCLEDTFATVKAIVCSKSIKFRIFINIFLSIWQHKSNEIIKNRLTYKLILMKLKYI